MSLVTELQDFVRDGNIRLYILIVLSIHNIRTYFICAAEVLTCVVTFEML